MIRIEQFLFEQNIEQSQAESLIAQFPNLSFNSPSDFINFFEKQNISLSKNKTTTTFVDKQELLQRFKDFKSSTDYDYVRQYISEEKKIQNAISAGNVSIETNLLDGITKQPLDPFFNFVVRKLLTGSETGVLPSEQLKSLLSELTKKTKQDIDTELDVTRDEIFRVVSFDNYLRNKGSVRVDLLDDRFTIESFNYVVSKEFTQLPEAVDAEKNILKKTAELSSISTPSTVVSPEEQKNLVENLKKLIIEDSNSIPALQSKLESIQKQLSDANELVDIKESDMEELKSIIDELAFQRNIIADENAIKDETIVALNEVIDATLSQLEDKVAQQLTNTTDAFDALATQIESQAKKSEEASAKQLEAFQKAVGGIADALKPKEPEPDPENPAAKIIKEINQLWDTIDIISSNKYSAFEKIIDKLGATKPTKSLYVYVPPSKGNQFRPSEELKQLLKWKDELKPQFKQLINGITDQVTAAEIKRNVEDITKDQWNINNAGTRAIVQDAILAWAIDFNKSRGIGTAAMRKVALELEESWTSGGNPIPDTDASLQQALDVVGAYEPSRNVYNYLSTPTRMNAKVAKASRDQLFSLVSLLLEIPTTNGY